MKENHLQKKEKFPITYIDRRLKSSTKKVAFFVGQASGNTDKD